MRRFFVYFLLMFLVFSCENKDENLLISYYENGEVQSSLHQDEDGKYDGECVWYYANGKKQLSVHYVHGVMNGLSERWHENGELEIRCFYRDNVYDSIFENYDESGHLLSRAKYEKGVLNGSFEQWYGDGKVYVDGSYLDGMMDGSWVMYYHSGAIASTAVFEHGTGIQKGYSEDGGYLLSLIHYVDNQKHGEEIHYDFEGNISSILLWEDGNYIGKK